MMCVSMSDPGMVVLPTHRLFRGLPPVQSQQLVDKLADCFTTELLGRGPAEAESVWSQIELEENQGTLGLYAAGDQQWMIARLTERGRQRMTEISADHCTEWQGLGVAILHRLVIDTLLGAVDSAQTEVRALDRRGRGGLG